MATKVIRQYLKVPQMKIFKDAPILDVDSDIYTELAYTRGEELVHQYLENAADVQRVIKAVQTIKEFQEALDALGLIDYHGNSKF